MYLNILKHRFDFHLGENFSNTMNTFIAMLRGINVSGQKKIRMEELKSLIESMGFVQSEVVARKYQILELIFL